MQSRNWKRWLATMAAASLLAGCGGEDGDDEESAQPAPQPPVTEPAAPVSKVLFIGVDGLTYPAYRQGMGTQALPGLAQFTVSRGWTGGVTGEATQQPTLALPGWATLLTGLWADRHGVRSDADNQALKADSLFARIRAAHPQARLGAVFHSSRVAALAGADRDAGSLQALTDCAGVDDCVAAQARDRINEGYDVVLAQFGAPGRAAAQNGFGAAYEATLKKTDESVAALYAQVAARRAEHPEENWLLVLASSHGLGKTGTADGLPLASNKTVLIGASLPAMLGASADDSAVDGQWDPGWYGLPSAADVAPTILAHMQALPAAAEYDLAGAPLGGQTALRRALARTSMDNKTVALSWTRVGQPPREIAITRDGAEVARLPGTAGSYEDSGFSFDTDGLHTLNYGISAAGSSASARATVNYVKPVPLLDSLRNGLTLLFPFEGSLDDRAAGGGGILPYDGVQAPAYADPGIFGQSLKNERGTAAMGAFRLEYPAGLLDTLSAFTIGFWYQSDGVGNDKPIVSNKDYNSGGNPGITIAQWAGAELRFNLGGSGRVDINGLKFTANKPVYIAMTVDKAAKKLSAYVYDAELGFMSRSVSTGSVDLGKVAGVFGPHLGLNEDGRGTYNACCSYDKSPSTMYFDDLALWSRALTPDEVKSLALSGKSVSALLP